LIDIGASDGYYAVGLLAADVFKTCTAFELDPTGQQIIQQSSIENNVQDRISIKKEASQGFLKQFQDETLANSLIIIDIEGHEFAIMDHDFFNLSKKSIIIVELHDWFYPNAEMLKNNLLKFAEQTHTVEFIKMGPRDLSKIKEIETFGDNTRWLLCSEGRARLMTWLVMKPHEFQCP